MNTILLAMLSLAGMAIGAEGTVDGVSVAPSKAETGQAISITVTGSNPCGEVQISTGDGAAATHPIPGLPSTHAHTYRKPGKYTITVQGRRNCDGEATTTIEVTGKPLDPEPPPVPRGIVTGIDARPEPARAGDEVTITLTGNGDCAVTLDLGDDTSRTVRGTLPLRATHVYAGAGRYTVVAIPEAPCDGRQTREIEVVGRQARAVEGASPRSLGDLHDLVADGDPAAARRPVIRRDGERQPVVAGPGQARRDRNPRDVRRRGPDTAIL